MYKTVWILNHYAGNMFLVSGGRHYYLAKYLKKCGYNPVIFCSNYDHFTRKNCVDSERLWLEKKEADTEIPYVFIKTRAYPNNGIKRVFNMIDFYLGMLKTANQYAKCNGKPDVIYASSVHPLALVAGIKIAKKFGIKCISEVRDLWPESIVAYSSKWTRKNPIMRVLYAGEKWIYKKSDTIIMTWAGGYDYIIDKGWQNVIPRSKVIHISNGVDIDQFNKNIIDNSYADADLSNHNYKTFVYSGSVRKVNNLRLLVLAAKELKELGNKEAKILVFGDGDELEALEHELIDNNIDNIIFKGRVAKCYIPSILSQSYASILHNSSTTLDKYGQSQNKFFEYLAAGRPILMTYSVGHSVIKKYMCGIELDTQTPQSIACAINTLCELSPDKYHRYCENAVNCSKMFDYKELNRRLINLIELNK
ncbi:MAG: glycosyltransferase family 4 protein [Eubacteriales bacterium]|nr:glycosyltransferase family 4 protein [Eubacteriales bacterium]